ncbi:hypothetical protein [Xylanimonas protaetiae]|uniref:Uncharacterized protein n=1 Tax=Xylanimonas protaetiae TaxID=2509457 RepID=A0A4P6FAD0_9MICO|nr:hypothetical protein [Xylanimonas protaetiae]QAY70347.1 hypothetical protein ET471_10155 [Xylanimonas protaetiae]
MPGSLRLTDLLARLHVFTGAPPQVRTADDAGLDAGGLDADRPGPAGSAGAVDGTLARVFAPPPGGPDAAPAGPTASSSGLRAALAGLGDASRASVLDPLGLSRPAPPVFRPAPVTLPFLADGAAPAAPAWARQVDETTCGAAVLSLLAMAGDPWLALQVARDPARRFAALQHRVHRACARTGPVPWPLRLGTAPWAAASVARFGDVRYTHGVVGGASGARVLRQAVRAASAGIPVPLFTGGDLRGGWQTAVPRHVVLLTAGAGDQGAGGVVRVYEPSSATMHAVPTALLLDPDAATERDRAALTAALGHWPHVVWAVLPR